MKLKLHIYSITLVIAMPRSSIMKPKPSIPNFDAPSFDALAQIFEIRSPMMKLRLSISSLRSQ